MVIQHLDQVTQENAAAAEEMSATSEQLAAQSDQLQAAMGFFTTGQEHHAPDVVLAARPAPAAKRASRRKPVEVFLGGTMDAAFCR